MFTISQDEKLIKLLKNHKIDLLQWMNEAITCYEYETALMIFGMRIQIDEIITRTLQPKPRFEN